MISFVKSNALSSRGNLIFCPGCSIQNPSTPRSQKACMGASEFIGIIEIAESCFEGKSADLLPLTQWFLPFEVSMLTHNPSPSSGSSQNWVTGWAASGTGLAGIFGHLRSAVASLSNSMQMTHG